MIIPVLMYHSISDDRSNLSVSVNNFERQIQYLYTSGFKTIQFNSIDEKIKKPLIITFDDGYKDNLINALPILKKYNFTSICFVVSDLIGKSNIWDKNNSNYVYKELLSKNDIKVCLDNGMFIGSHGKSHRSLIELNTDEIIREIKISKTVLENIIGNKIDCFSYPFGSVTKLSANLVNKSYHFAVSTMRSRFDTNKHKNYFIPRVHMSNNLNRFKLFMKIKTFYEDIKYNEKQLHM